MKTAPPLLLLLSVLFCSMSHVPAGCAEWELSTSNHFHVRHHPENRTLAREVVRRLEKSYPIVTLDVGHTLTKPVTVYITTSNREFRSLTQGALPDWGVGCAFPDSNLILLRAGPEEISTGRLGEIAIHELSHIVLGQALGDKHAPRWFDEGLAMYESREWDTGRSLTMAKAVFSRNIIPLKRIDSVLSFDRDKAQLAYTQSFLAVSFLIREYGLDPFRQIIRRLADTGNMDTAMTEVIGLRFTEFESTWYTHVTKKYGWLSFFTNSYYLWIGISLLFLLAFLAKKYWNKRTVERWDTEEKGLYFDDEQDYYDY